MEENTSTAAENNGAEGTMDVQGKPGGEGQKLFTQEEVNSFVQSRLSRYKVQADKESQREYDQKLQELKQRELKLLVKEQLSEREMPRELADIITCTDETDLKQKLDMLQRLYGGSTAKKESGDSLGFVVIGASGGNGAQGPDPIREAMGLHGKG